MSQNGRLSNSTVELVLEKLHTDMDYHRAEIEKIEQAIKEFDGQIKMTLTSSPSKRRLPPGMPKKFVIDALIKHGDLTMAELRRKIEEDTGQTIRDGTARRALEALMKEDKVVKKEETGAYLYIGM